MLDQQAIMQRKILEQRNKEKKKNNLIAGLSVAVTVLMATYFGRALYKDIKLDRLARQAAQEGGPTGAQRELGVKTREELLGLFTDVSHEKSFEDIRMSGTLKEQLETIMDKLKNPQKYEEAMQELMSIEDAE
jgi:hypothetical protein